MHNAAEGSHGGLILLVTGFGNLGTPCPVVILLPCRNGRQSPPTAGDYRIKPGGGYAAIM